VQAKGAVPLAWAENGFREVTNSKVEIRKPDDMKGLKLRVVGSPIYNDMFTALGANPTQMSWADAQPALTTGAVDGQENPLTIYSVLKMHELGQTNVTLWGYVADPLIFAVNQQVWDSFTPEDQEILKQAAVDAGAHGIEVARKGMTDGDQSLIEEIKGYGVNVVTLTDEERQAFVDATRDVYADWKDKIGADLVNMAEESIANR
jgi:TRAP-type C4-dicarboxylate transport system substrate-binding protein